MNTTPLPPTPRCDAEVYESGPTAANYGINDPDVVVDYTFAQQLERELIEATQALTALSELERMAVEPVAWKHDCAALLANDVELWIDNCPHCGRPRAAPPAKQQQYEAGDMASAHNDGFRAGVASVAQQPQAEAVPVGVLHRGEGGAFRFGHGDHLLGLYALPPGEHDLYTAPQQAEAVPDLTGCNCLWRGDEVVARCELHEAWHVAIHEWAERAKTAESQQAGAVPSGFVLVPVEPTEAVLRALIDCQDADPEDGPMGEADALYRAMLAAAQGEKS